MRYIADSNGYLLEVSFGAIIQCNGKDCTEYTGGVPSGYDDLVDWFIKEGDKLYRWKVHAGQLTLDSSVPVLNEPGRVYAPADFGLGTKTPPTISGTEQLDACRTCGFYRLVYGGTVCGVFFNFASLSVYNIYGDECVQEVRPLNSNCCLRRFWFNGSWSGWEIENPPMSPGVEYRTTERYNGKPVYVKLINFGNLPNTGNKDVTFYSDETVRPISVATQVGKELDSLYMTIPAHFGGYGFWVSAVNYKTIRITTEQNNSDLQARVIVKYWKSTD